MQQGRQPNTRLWIRKFIAIGRAEDERIAPLPADECLASISRSPEIHVGAGSAEHDVAVRGTARRWSAIRPTEDDVPAWTAVHHIVAVQAKHHIVTRSPEEDVGAIERLVRSGAGLNRHVVLPV